MSALEMVYSRDGILALLTRKPCPGVYSIFGKEAVNPTLMHTSCGCDSNHHIWPVVSLHLLEPDEADWVWHRCPTRHQADV